MSRDLQEHRRNDQIQPEWGSNWHKNHSNHCIIEYLDDDIARCYRVSPVTFVPTCSRSFGLTETFWLQMHSLLSVNWTQVFLNITLLFYRRELIFVEFKYQDIEQPLELKETILRRIPRWTGLWWRFIVLRWISIEYNCRGFVSSLSIDHWIYLRSRIP